MDKDNKLLVGGHWFPLDPAEGDKKFWLATIAKAEKRQRKLLAAMQKVLSDEGTFRKRQSQYVACEAVWFTRILCAAKNLDPADRQTVGTYREQAKIAKRNIPFDEPVLVRVKAKGQGKYRHYCVFGVMLHAAQIILRDVLAPSFSPQVWQFGVKNRGTSHAIQSVRKHYEAGFTFAAVLDIRSFFDRFHHSGIGPWETLPVPYPLKMRAAVGRYLKLEKGETQNQTATHTEHINGAIDYMKTAGLLPGSAFSGMAAAHILSKLSPCWPSTARIINYVDDFLVLARSKTELDKAVFALRASIEAISVGKFELLEKSGNSVPTSIEFLGHHIWADSQGHLHVEVTNKSIDKFTASFYKDCDHLEAVAKIWGCHPAAVTLLMERSRRLAKRIKSWAASFSEADDVEGHLQYFENVFSSVVEGFGLNAEIMLAGAKKPFHSGWESYGG